MDHFICPDCMDPYPEASFDTSPSRSGQHAVCGGCGGWVALADLYPWDGDYDAEGVPITAEEAAAHAAEIAAAMDALEEVIEANEARAYEEAMEETQDEFDRLRAAEIEAEARELRDAARTLGNAEAWQEVADFLAEQSQ